MNPKTQNRPTRSLMLGRLILGFSTNLESLTNPKQLKKMKNLKSLNTLKTHPQADAGPAEGAALALSLMGQPRQQQLPLGGQVHLGGGSWQLAVVVTAEYGQALRRVSQPLSPCP